MLKSSLRIIAITGQFRPLVGGTEAQTAWLAAAWAARGHLVEVWTRRLERNHPTHEMEGGATVRRLGWASGAKLSGLGRLERLLFSFSLLARLVAHRNTYDVVIAQQALYPAFVAAVASWLTGRPLVLRVASTGLTSDFEGWGGATRLVLAVLRQKARAVIVMNHQGILEAAAAGFAPERVHRIPNGLALGEPPPPQPRNQIPRVVYVGGLRAEKRVDLLLRAWAAARSPGELLLAGEGRLRADLEALARQLRIAPVFLGNIEDPRELLRKADVFVLPSDAEGMSNALLEAMAEGCACLATCVGGNVDCLAPDPVSRPAPGEIAKGRVGWLVGPGDEVAMAKALRMLCGDVEERQALGRRAREKVIAEHGLERAADAYLTVFANVT